MALRRKSSRTHLWVLLAYAGLSLLLTWPLAAHLATHVSGDGIDDPSLAWNLWWIKHALVDRPQDPFISSWIFWPVGINLAFYTLTVLNGLLALPLQLVSGVIPAYNALLLSSFVLGGYGAYLLCRDVLSRAPRTFRMYAVPAAFAGGLLYAFASAKLFYAALGQGNVASSQWVPFVALYILRAARPSGRWRDAGLAALFLVLQAYAEQTYASFLVIFAALALLWRLAGLVASRAPGGPVRRSDAGRAIARFALMAALFGAGLLPFLADMLPDLRAEGDFFTSGGGFADVFSADLAGYLVPTQLHPLLGGVTRRFAAAAQFPIDKGQQVYAGYVALALAALGLWAALRARRPAASRGWPGPTFWAVSSALFFLLTLGPTLRVAGHNLGLPLPFALVAQLPFFKGNRYPSRYSVMLLLSLAPLLALGLSWLLARLAASGEHSATRGEVFRSGAPAHPPATRAAVTAPGVPGPLPAGRSVPATLVALVLPSLMLFEHLSLPLPLSDLSVPALYGRIARTPGDFAMLELPPGWRNGAYVLGKQDVIIMQEMWNQTAHGKRLLGGNTSRNPEFKFQYFAEDPTLSRLLAPTNAADLPQHDAMRALLAQQPVTQAERNRARDWAAFLDLRFVMVHRDRLPAETEAALKALLPVHLVAEEGILALYELDPGPPPAVYRPGSDAGRMVLAEGWSPPAPAEPGVDAGAPAWAGRREAALLLPLGQEASRLRLHGWSPVPGQFVVAYLDGRRLGEGAIAAGPGWLTFDVPADPARAPLSRVTLRFAALAPVAGLPSAQPIMLPDSGGAGGASGLAGLLVRSAGGDTGNLAHIYVDGIDLSPNQRGYNLVARLPGAPAPLTAGAGRAEGWSSASFDTHLDSQASARLAQWVAALPEGTLVLGAARDEAAMNLKPAAVEALGTLGVQGNLRGHFRWGHAFIGVKGAAPGTAVEAMDGVRPVQVGLGLPVDSPDLAAAIDEIRIERLRER